MVSIEIQRVRSYISEDWRGALVKEAVGSRCEGHRSGDGLVARLQGRSKRGAVQCGRPRTEADCVLGSYIRSKGLFEAGDLRTGSQPIRSQDIHHRLNIAFINSLMPVRKQRFADGVPAVDC